MGFTSLQVCMDSSDWLQGPIHDENTMDISSSSPSDDILTCSRPLMERRLRPPHDQPQKCPRCDSTHTKFCYYNNYSLSQPRYFCKACRRYWTKGGSLRNIPIGGGCRKNKKVSTTNPRKLSNDTNHPQGLTMNTHNLCASSSNNSPDLQMSHFMGMYGGGSMFESPRLGDHFVENKYDFMANLVAPNSHAISSPFGMGMDMYQTTMLPYHDDHHQGAMDVKPSTKLLALEWQGQGFSHDQSVNYHDSFGYVNNGIGFSWNGLINGYGSSDTNPRI